MKNSVFLLLFAILSAALFGCQKESAPESADVLQPYVKTVLKFNIGERSYELSAVREEMNYQDNGGCVGGGCNNAPAKDFSNDWNTYEPGNFLTVTRQDDAAAPGFRLSLMGIADLRNGTFPAPVAKARILLNDFNGALIQPNDDPAYNIGALLFEGNEDAVQLTVSSRSGNVVQGTFAGVLKMANGSTLEIRDGTFTAQLMGL